MAGFLLRLNAFDNDRLITAHIAWKRTGVPERTLRHWAATGKVKAKKLGKRAWGIVQKDVEELALQRGCCHAEL